MIYKIALSYTYQPWICSYLVHNPGHLRPKHPPCHINQFLQTILQIYVKYMPLQTACKVNIYYPVYDRIRCLYLKLSTKIEMLQLYLKITSIKLLYSIRQISSYIVIHVMMAFLFSQKHCYFRFVHVITLQSTELHSIHFTIQILLF